MDQKTKLTQYVLDAIAANITGSGDCAVFKVEGEYYAELVKCDRNTPQLSPPPLPLLLLPLVLQLQLVLGQRVYGYTAATEQE